MSAPISVVIPTLDAATQLPRAMQALFEGLQAGLIRELIVSDGGSGDATQAIAEAAGARWIDGAPGRGGQLARGCAVARAPWLLVLHADTQLAPGWTVAVEAALQRPDRAHVFRLAFRADGPGAAFVAGWANRRTAWFGLPYGDQGLLIHRDLYARVGGYPDIPLMEDVALVRALPERPLVMPATARTDAGRYLADGWLRRGARNLWTLARYLAGTPPERLLRGYVAGG